MEWYRSSEEVSKIKIKGKQTILDIIKEGLMQKDEEGKEPQPPTKVEAFKWFDENYDLVVTTLAADGLAITAQPLIDLEDKFKKYRDEL